MTTSTKIEAFQIEIESLVMSDALELSVNDDDRHCHENIVALGTELNLSEGQVTDFLEKIIDDNTTLKNLACSNKWDVPSKDDWSCVELYKISDKLYLKKITEPPHNFERLFFLNDELAAQLKDSFASEVDILYEKTYFNKSMRIDEKTVFYRDESIDVDYIYIDYKTLVYFSEGVLIFEENLGAIGSMGGFVDKVTKVVVKTKNIERNLVEDLISGNFKNPPYYDATQKNIDELGLDCRYFLNLVQELLKKRNLIFKQIGRVAS